MFYNTTADELLVLEGPNGELTVVELYHQSTWGPERMTFKRQTTTGVYLLSTSPVTHVIVSGQDVEEHAPAKPVWGGGKGVKDKGEPSDKFNLSQFPKDFLKSHTVYGTLDTVKAAELYVEAAQKVRLVVFS